MFVELAMKLSQVSPWCKRLLWKRWYQYLAGYQRKDWRFMNYGYAPVDDGSQPLVLDSNDEPDRYAIQLYDRVAGAVVTVFPWTDYVFFTWFDRRETRRPTAAARLPEAGNNANRQ